MANDAAEEFVKIVVDLPEAEDGVGGEGLWSVRVGKDLFEVRNSPWHTTEINYMDIVKAVAPHEDKNPVFVEVYKRGGHRTIQIVFLEIEGKETILRELNVMGATYEGASGNFYAIDLKPEIDFDHIADYLEELQEKGKLEARYAAQPQPAGTGELVN